MVLGRIAVDLAIRVYYQNEIVYRGSLDFTIRAGPSYWDLQINLSTNIRVTSANGFARVTVDHLEPAFLQAVGGPEVDV